MAAIGILAQHIMDLYYQSFKSDDEFFELLHFEYLAGVAYAKLLQNEYENNYKLNLHEEGYGYVTLSQDWLRAEEHKIKKDADGRYFIQLDMAPFSFLYDSQNSSIQDVIPLGQNSQKEFIRMGSQERWKIKASRGTRIIFWYLEKDKIYAASENTNGMPERLKVLYVPAPEKDISDDFTIPVTKEADIISWVLNIMFTARQGTVVDMTNDANPNKTLATEINNIFSQIKTKA
jgi:hypothetical protein